MVSIRRAVHPLTKDELALIIQRMKEARDKIGSPLLTFASQDKIERQFRVWSREGTLETFVDEEGNLIGILAFDIVEDWWSDAKILVEQFVFCVSPTYKGFGRIAVEELHRIAEENNVDFITSGCFFMQRPQIVTNLYKKAGFTEINPMYIKILRR